MHSNHTESARPSDQELFPLSQIFDQSLFRIPDYQRGYSWEIKEYGMYWEDLRRLEPDREHYAGQITVRRASPEDTRHWHDEQDLIESGLIPQFLVVDGQQRLTTSIILLKCLCDSMAEEDTLRGLTRAEIERKYLYHTEGMSSSVPWFGYALGGACYEFFKEKVLGLHSTGVHRAESLYTLNLTEAVGFFRAEIQRLTPEERGSVFASLTEGFLFTWVALRPELDEFVVFETMNNRGLPVSDFDLLKNRLIHLCQELPDLEKADRRTLRNEVNQAWTFAYEQLGGTRDPVLNNEKDFLIQHAVLHFGRWWGELDFLLLEHFTVDHARSGVVDFNAIRLYTQSLRSSAQAWRRIHAPKLAEEMPEDLREGLRRLRRLSHGAFTPLLMAAFARLSPDWPALARLLDAAEGFRFAVGALCRRRANTGDTHFYNLAHRIHNGSQSLDGAIGEIHSWNRNHFGLGRAIEESESRFRWNKGFYSWAWLRFLLYEFEQHVRVTEFNTEISKLDWDSFTAKQGEDFTTVEHIFPGKPRTGEWPAFEGLEEDHAHRLRQSLGNLLPLSRSRNSHLSNARFSVKRGDDGLKNGYSTGCFSELDVARQGDWSPQCVVDRGLRMIEFIEERWGVSFGIPEQRLQFLGLEFWVSPTEGPPASISELTELLPALSSDASASPQPDLYPQQNQ